MKRSAQPIISAAVEGYVDEAVVRKLVTHTGAQLGAVYGKTGKSALREKIGGYNNAAKLAPWIVLVDLDQDATCAPSLREEWIAVSAEGMCFRIAVRAIEAWLMADAAALAAFLGISRERIAKDPEVLPHPKTAMVNLARGSRRTAIRDDMVPRAGSGRATGPAYAARLVEFVDLHWRPNVAAERSDSLRRSMLCLGKLVDVSG